MHSIIKITINPISISILLLAKMRPFYSQISGAAYKSVKGMAVFFKLYPNYSDEIRRIIRHCGFLWIMAFLYNTGQVVGEKVGIDNQSQIQISFKE